MDLAKVKGLGEWPEVRTRIEAAVLEMLGTLPKERAELQVKVTDEQPMGGLLRQQVNYFIDDWTRVSAWLFIPDGKEDLPAIVCCHRQVECGRDEPAGLGGEPSLALALHYARQGYISMAPDCILAGDRVSTGLAPFDARNFSREYPKMSLIGKMLADHIHAVDVLMEIKRVDPARIGVMGHGLGGTNALLLAAFDERVQTCVASCGFTRFADDKHVTRWAEDAKLPLLPKIAKAAAAKEYPFDWEHILALIAPNPTLILAPENNSSLSNARSCAKAVKRAQHVYKLLGAGSALTIFSHDAAEVLTQDLLEVADDWFDRWL
jgi:dienelactone hydrolase